jgi:hypothetical protein
MTSLSAYIQGRIKNRHNKEDDRQKLTCYNYSYSCDRWWGYTEGVRNIACDGTEEEVITEAHKTAKRITGSSNCKIEILEKFFMIISLPRE